MKEFSVVNNASENKIEKSKSETIKHLVSAFEKGLDDEECIGYHGTSLEAIEYLIENGYLPGLVEDDVKLGYEKGNIFFYPRKSAFPDHPDFEKFFGDEEVVDSVRIYATIIARAHYIVKSLGLDLGNPEHQYIGRILGDGDSPEADEIKRKLIEENGKTRKEINEILAKAKERKGVLLTLDKKILSSHKIDAGDDDEQDLRIVCPEGLSFDNISGIEPGGQIEWEFFEKIQNKL